MGRRPRGLLSVGSLETEQRREQGELRDRAPTLLPARTRSCAHGTAGTEPCGLGRVGCQSPTCNRSPRAVLGRRCHPAPRQRLCRGIPERTEAHPCCPSAPTDQTPRRHRGPALGTGSGLLAEVVRAQLRAGRKATARRQENHKYFKKVINTLDNFLITGGN